MAMEQSPSDRPVLPVAARRSGLPVRSIALVAVVAFAVVFVLQNRERTNIDFLVFELRSRTWAAIVAAMALGVVLDRLVLAWWRRRTTR